MEFTENFTKYNKKQVDFIFAMLETGNISKSAKIANITETTSFKYLKNGLSEEINKIRKRYIEESLKKLEYASVKATDTIINILEDGKSANSVRLNASKTIDEKYNYIDIAKEAVKSKLNYPNTAKFPWLYDEYTVSYTDRSKIIVKGQVTSSNAFGVSTTNTFEVTFENDVITNVILY